MHKHDAAGRPERPVLAIIKDRKRLRILIGVTFLLLALLIIWILTISRGESGRTEAYKDVSGTAGIEATINYTCPGSCERKFDFNVYLFSNDGQQISVVRPDKDGTIRAALPEGEYIMLIGKRFGKEKLFPQEPLALKNGKSLELKLNYREG